MKIINIGFKNRLCLKTTNRKKSFNKYYRYHNYNDTDDMPEMGCINRVFPVFINLKYRRTKYQGVYYKNKGMRLKEIKSLDDIYIIRRYSILDKTYQDQYQKKDEFSSFKEAKQFIENSKR